MSEKHTVCVDPGLRGCGVAIFENAHLIHAAYVKSPEQKERGPVAWRAMAGAVFEYVEEWLPAGTLVIEVPQVYRGAQQKGDPDDLLQLVGVEGWLGGLLMPARVVGYRPREWKGQIPKDVHNRRVEKALETYELAQFAGCPAYLKHNVLDAVGLGLFHLGRLVGQGIRRAG